MERKLVLLSVSLTLFALTVLAQDLSVDVNLAMLSVLVEDQDGNPVLDLNADDFEVLENGRAKPVKHFSLQKEPVTVGLLVDSSSSIDPVKKDLDRAATEVSETFGTGDEAFLMTFAGAGRLEVAPTKQYGAIVEGIRKRKLEFGTRFYDVIIESLQYLAANRIQHKALIVFSDGADHYSVHSFQEMLNKAASYGYPIYLLGYVGNDSRTWSERGRREVRDQFQQIARATGGKSFFPAPGADYSKLARELVNSVGYAYRLGFYHSEPFASEVNFQLRLRGERSRGLSVRVLRDAIPISRLELKASVGTG